MTVTECRKLLCLAEKGVTRRSTRPLQNAVLLERDAEDRWRFTASDLEFVDVSTWEDGFDGGRVVYAIAPTPKVLKGALKGKLGKADVRLCPVTKTEVDLHVEGTTKTVSRLKGLSAEEFETIPASEGQHSCDLSERDRATMQHVAKASSTDETRPTLTGVLFRFGEDMNHPEVSATDTHRLAKSTLDAEAEGGHPGADYITRRRALDVLAKASKGEGAVRASFSEGTVEFRGTNWRLRTRRVDGQFPNYLAVIPDARGCITGFVADSETLRASVEGLLSVASEDADRVVFALGGKGLQVSAKAEAVGEAHAELETEVRGPGDTWPLALNGRYLLDALPDAGPVTVSWGPFPAPARIEGEGETVGVVMPMELGGFEDEDDEAAPVAADEPEVLEQGEPEVEPVEAPTEAPKPVCAVCEDTGELYTLAGAARPCPECRSTVETSPEPVEVPAEAPEVVAPAEEPEAEPVEAPTELPAPRTPEPVLSLV
ncbi:MAG TPA: DNA polymerase III subunit beta, partial [Armatimonadota bacterium]|nr:DNA polymerase III subunit beta [Armatimonadota bacterium]